MDILIPDLVLRDAYVTVAKRHGVGRDEIIARDDLIDEVKIELGPKYAHVPDSWIRKRIFLCCKNPNKHGGNWNVTPDRKGPSKGHKKRVELSPELQEHYESHRWKKEVKPAILERDGYRCVICNSSHMIDGHHRTYEFIDDYVELEIANAYCLCRPCHDLFTKVKRKRGPIMSPLLPLPMGDE